MKKRMIAWLLCACMTFTAAPEMLLADVAGNAQPVSYTHLDVYKRQVCMLYFKSHECENCFHANIRYNRWKRIYCLPTKRLVCLLYTSSRQIHIIC